MLESLVLSAKGEVPLQLLKGLASPPISVLKARVYLFEESLIYKVGGLTRNVAMGGQDRVFASSLRELLVQLLKGLFLLELWIAPL